ncbi:MAG: hypothetical protein GX957_15440 [Clostridiaceae bacterium]|nr:hypothetical protein [Clostridiaceae bacterium]
MSNLTDGRANASASPTGKVTGEVTVTVSGSGQLDSYVALNQYGVMANATKNLIFIDVPRASVDVSLNQWSNVTLKGTSRVYATVPYSAPSKSLNIDHGSQLILMEDQVIPSELQNYGDRIVLGQYSYDFENENYYARKYMKGSSGQAISIFGDKVFMFNSNGLCNVYDLSTKSPTPIATFPLGSYNTGTAPDGSIDSRYANHCNTAMFSNTFYQGNNIPLLYVTSGNSGDYDEDGYIGRCAVENISVVNGQYSSQLVQTIIYNPNHPSTDSLSAKGWENPCWGSPQSFVDTENGWYYLFSTRYRTNNRDPQIVENNCYIITKFQLPQVTESNTKVILVADDIVDQFTIPFEAFFTQGGTLYNNKIYFLFGCGEINGWPNSLLVFNLEDKLLEASIDLSDSIFRTEEPEGAAVYNGKLMINTAQGYICQFDYVESNWIDLVDGGKKTIDCLSGETLLYISP